MYILRSHVSFNSCTQCMLCIYERKNSKSQRDNNLQSTNWSAVLLRPLLPSTNLKKVWNGNCTFELLLKKYHIISKSDIKIVHVYQSISLFRP